MALNVIDKINSCLEFLHRQNLFLTPPLCQLICNALIQSLFDYASVLQIRDFQSVSPFCFYTSMVGQRAEGLMGILRPKLVQESLPFLLPRSTKNHEN